jgi:hypothetical protein
MKAYNNVGQEYFYCGDLERAKYYSNRGMRGATEIDGSNLKSVSLNLLKTKQSRLA